MFRISGLSIESKDLCIQSLQTVIPPGSVIMGPALLSLRRHIKQTLSKLSFLSSVPVFSSSIPFLPCICRIQASAVS